LIPWKFTLALNILALVSITLAVFFTYRGAFPFQSPLGIYRILPGDILLDLVWTYVLAFAVGIIVYLITPLMARLSWHIHRAAKGRSHRYYIQRRSGEPGMSPQKRLLTPAFVALGLSFSLSGPATQSLIFVTENFASLREQDAAIVSAMPVLFIAILVSSFVLLIFTPVWLLDDVGLISEKKIKGSRVTADIEGVGQFFMKYLRGFAGISTIIGYLLLAVQMVNWYQFMLTQTELMYPLFVYFIPVTVVFAAPLIAMAPISVVDIFYELSVRRNAGSVLRSMERSGISVVTVEFLATAARAPD
jgi:hypothetical protein